MIDLHVHLLHGVDDGPADLDEARTMCRIADEDGITLAVATPHQLNERWPNLDRRALERVHRELVLATGGRPEIRLGAEIRIGSDLLAEVDRLPGGDLLPLAGSRALLLEPPPLPVGPGIVDLVHELVLAGYRPVIAHPERVRWLTQDLLLLKHAVDRGAWLQVTAMALMGDLGRTPHMVCHTLLGAGLVHVVASDGHDPVRRPPRLRAAFEAVAAAWGEDTATRLFVDNPRDLIEDTAGGRR